MTTKPFHEVVAHHRRMALEFPCEYPADVKHPRYQFVLLPAARVRCAVTVTVNVNDENILLFEGQIGWMVNVSLNGWPRRNWAPLAVKIVDAVLTDVLKDAGLPDTDRREDGEYTRAMFRHCNVLERRAALQKFVAPTNPQNVALLVPGYT